MSADSERAAHRTGFIAGIMHNVRQLRLQTAIHTGESCGNLDVLERRIEDSLREFAGLLAVQPELELAAPVAALPQEPTNAARDVLAERQRQVESEGWTTEHDDAHSKGEMPLAAACYAAHTATWQFINYGLDPKGGLFHRYQGAQEFVGRMWPWDKKWWKPRDDRSNLVRAAALILAEIERMDRKGLIAAVLPPVAPPARPHQHKSAAVLESLRAEFQRAKSAAPPAQEPPTAMVAVTKEDANNYCRILTALGMEEEGDPVAEVERLAALAAPVAAPTPSAPDTSKALGFLDGGDAARAGREWVEARITDRQSGHIDDYHFEYGKPGADGGAIVLWEKNSPQAVALLLRDDLNRSKLVLWRAALAAPVAALPQEPTALREAARTAANILEAVANDLQSRGRSSADERRAAGQLRTALSAQAAPPAQEPPRNDGFPVSADERKLRRLLCGVFAGPLAYMDDGEAQDGRARPMIDFMRDSADEIQQKIWARNRAALEAALSAAPPAQEPPPDDARAVVFDADLYELLMNLQNGIRTRVDKQQANATILKLDRARAAMKATVAPPAQEPEPRT